MSKETANADLRTISLCSGYGGLDIGFHRAFPNAHTVLYVENEIPAASILVENIKKGRLDDAPIWSDLKTFDAGPWRGRVDAILGGYPCQPFSVAGKRKGTEDPRHLWPYIARIVDTIRPRICVFENVRGHVRLGLSEVLGELRGLGYRVRAGIFSAAEVGAPHRRERVFIFAEMANAESGQRGGRGGREKAKQSYAVNCCDSTTLADSMRAGLEGHTGPGSGGHEPGWLAQIQDGQAADGCGTLADTVSERRRGGGIRHGESASARDEAETQVAGSCFGWPSRPGEDQHEWEEPRTIDGKLNPSWVAQLMGLPADWVEVSGLTREMKLRALGNGVVPQQAELAIRTLTGTPQQSSEQSILLIRSPERSP